MPSSSKHDEATKRQGKDGVSGLPNGQHAGHSSATNSSSGHHTHEASASNAWSGHAGHHTHTTSQSTASSGGSFSMSNIRRTLGLKGKTKNKSDKKEKEAKSKDFRSQQSHATQQSRTPTQQSQQSTPSSRQSTQSTQSSLPVAKAPTKGPTKTPTAPSASVPTFQDPAPSESTNSSSAAALSYSHATIPVSHRTNATTAQPTAKPTAQATATTKEIDAEDADSAFLKALREESGASSKGGAGAEIDANSTTNSVESSNEADTAFLKALRGDASHASHSSNVSNVSGASSASSGPVSSNKTDSAFLKALSGEEGGSSAMDGKGQISHDRKKSEDASNDVDSYFLRALRGGGEESNVSSTSLVSATSDRSLIAANTKKRGKVQPPVSRPKKEETNTRESPQGRNEADSAFLRALRGGDDESADISNESKGSNARSGMVQPPVSLDATTSKANNGQTSADNMNDVDSAFLKALRGGGGEQPKSRSSETKECNPKRGKVQPPVKTSRGAVPANTTPIATTDIASDDNMNDANSAFLRALRGGGGGEELADSSNESKVSNPKRGKVQPPVSRGTTTSKASADNMNDADSAFLRALRGVEDESSGSGKTGGTSKSETPTNSSDDADSAFLRALRGSTDDSSSHSNTPHKAAYPPSSKVGGLSYADVDFLAAMRGDSTPAKGPLGVSKGTPGSSPPLQKQSQLSKGNSAMEGLPTPPLIPGRTHGRRGTGSSIGSDSEEVNAGSFVFTSNNQAKLNATSQPMKNEHTDDIAHANAAFLGALHASSDTPDDVQGDHHPAQRADGSFIINPKSRLQHRGSSGAHHKKESTPRDAFLLSLNSNVSSSQSSFLGQSALTEGTGTFVMTSPKGVKGGQSDMEQSNAAFMMAIHASSEDGDAQELSKNAVADAAQEAKDKLGAKAEVAEEDDDDPEDLKVPTQPYIEKVMLPRPLFFGHTLPYRIMDEAKKVASASLKEAEVETSAPVSADAPSNGITLPASAHPLKAPNHVTPSTFGGGAKSFSSNLLPCYRNLEGAIEAFGFGTNPFSIAIHASEEEKESNLLEAPHPYVSIYSPVWGHWARKDRAKARRRKAKLSPNAVTSSANSTSRMQTQQTSKKKKKNFGPNRVVAANDEKLKSLTQQTHDVPSVSRRQSEEESSDTLPTSVSDDVTDDSSFSQDLFSKYARAESFETNDAFGGDGGDTFIGTPKIEISNNGTFVPKPAKNAFSPPPMDSNTFVQAVKSNGDSSYSDDDSIEAAEERKTVGLNDNISAAAAMLAGEGVDGVGDDNVGGGIGASMFMASGGGAKASNCFGRPYTNYELTNGCCPQFGSDDPSLPHESDLGIFETKEDEKRSLERRREKDIIEDFAVPGLMPYVTCPIQCTDLDDSQSWNSRDAASDMGTRNNTNTVLISLDGNSTTDQQKSSGSGNDRNKNQIIFETTRVGWWNLPESYGESSVSTSSKSRRNSKHPSVAVEMFTALDDPIPLDVQTNLWPPPALLRDNNFSASRLHSATSTARFLPHLSDRPPSFRHLQIDTTAVGFPKLGGEIEPLYCSVRIFHFELTSEGSSGDATSNDAESVSTSFSSSVPSPNMERCGWVTESLNFDVVQDPSVVKNCKRALWPYAGDSQLNGLCNESEVPNNIKDDDRLEGTPCGVFPLHSNLNISNLYAVIIVHKVVAESADLQPYYKPNRRDLGKHPKQEVIDLAKLRENAGKASEACQFITPFAFGVVPLMHIIGNETPKVPISRAVQIPLFKFLAGRGAHSILDHILVMLHPRAEPKVGKAAAMTRGHALLVMRYFGYLGLHSIIEKKSSLARGRLVDFTGELQVKRKDDTETSKSENAKEKYPDFGDSYVLPPWKKGRFIVEAAPFGGRNTSKMEPDVVSDDKGVSNDIYAQEITAIPLERSGVETGSSRARSRNASLVKSDGMLVHTSFCNELICQLKILKKCPKKNIVIKVEMRELQWSENLNVNVALPVKPSIHNTRRGPWLVQEAFSSCAIGTAEPLFLDEFKIKLPLVLGESGHEKIGLFFTVYNVNVKKKRFNRLRSISKRSTIGGEIDLDENIERLGSGFLQLTLEDSPTCLIANGDHEIPINFRTVQLADTVGKEKNISPTVSGRHRKSWSWSSNNSIINSFPNKSNEIRLSLSNETISETEVSTEFPISTDANNYPRGTLALGRLQGRNERNVDAENPDDDANSDDNSVGSEDSFKSDSGTRHVVTKPKRRYSCNENGIKPISSAGNPQDLDYNSKHSYEELSDSKDMILQVNVVAFTSVHPQNKILSDLFLTKPNPPRSVLSSDFLEPYSPWGKNRSEILYRLKPERIPPFNFVGGILAETERKLLEPVIGLSKSSKCPHSDLMPHLVRVISQLLRTMVSGVGEPSILWASPESLIPLRLNAFATLLHTVSSASHHMAKAGRQLDGSAKWNLASLGKLLVLLFDEWSIMGGPMEEVDVRPIEDAKKEKEIQDSSNKSLASGANTSNSPLSKPAILSQRSKTTDEKLDKFGATKPGIISRYSSDDSNIKRFDVDAMLNSSVPTLDCLHNSSDKVEDSDQTDLVSHTSGASGFKVDSKSDFMSALTASSLEKGQDSVQSTFSNKALADSLISSFGSSTSYGPAANRRRWMTLPTKGLATIQENDVEDSRGSAEPSHTKPLSSTKQQSNVDCLDSELVIHPDKAKPRQFRVPQLNQDDNTEVTSASTTLDDILLVPIPPKKDSVGLHQIESHPDKSHPPPANDDDIESTGTAFLDVISKSMGFGQGLSSTEMGGEEKRVGAAHHRKTRSRCSIDWSLPPTDMLLEKDQQMEQLNRTRIGKGVQPSLTLSPIGSFPDDGSTDDDTAGNSSSEGAPPQEKKGNGAWNEMDASSEKVHPLKRLRNSNTKEISDKSKTTNVMEFPDFADRMSAMQNDGKGRRWWPYVYEVIIFQWVALLVEQTKKGESSRNKTEEVKSTPGLSPIVVKYLTHAAKAARGATIRCAPYLLELIKQSLAWRIDSIRREKKKFTPESRNAEEAETDYPTPLVRLDESIISALEKLITMLTDASIDSRNFDSYEFRKISIDVNDAVVCFLRDLFSMLDVQTVHRLVLVYFSRFVTKEGKHWHDRDSKVTGLRCSWETTKLRLNAITLFIRFPEFMKVNSPLMDSWESWPVGSSVSSTRIFFSDVLEKINSLGLSDFTSSEGPVRKDPLKIPRMKPHWLAELCTDICLSATGHAEQTIQHRASSLLFELFWQLSQQGRAKGNISVVASVFVPFIPKILGHLNYLSSLPAKSQLRKDLLPCALLVLQSAPVGIMRALWRKLAKRAEGKTQQRDFADRYGGIVGSGSGIGSKDLFSTNHEDSFNSLDADDFEMLDSEPDIFDVFGLLNLSLTTIEYEGNGQRIEENTSEIPEFEEHPVWRKEFLLSVDKEQRKTTVDPRRFPMKRGNDVAEDEIVERSTTSNARRWHAHDCAMVIIHTCRHIVRETLGMLRPSLESKENESDCAYPGFSTSRTLSDCFLHQTSFSNSLDSSETGNLLEPSHEEKIQSKMQKRVRKSHIESLTFSVTDTIIFVRAATSVYLHALTMKQSDVVITKTLTAAVEIVKIFGIKVFLAAVGETLQHWMRVILEHCGHRRPEVRVDALEFLNLLLRLTWDSYGSFFRVRLPLLAVQTEVMERIVAKAATKYVVEQRRLGLDPILLSNECAEACLAPMWRTVHRLQNQSVSQNLSFRSALARLALMLKKLYKAYLAAHALAIVNRSQLSGKAVPSHSNPFVQRMRVSVHRILSNTAGFSKQFLGNQASIPLDHSSIQDEAIEDSFRTAADVFSSTELPSHRVAWLQKLADFHRMRDKKFAEEATCRCQIYHTYKEAAKQHEHIWSSSPFLPWASNSSDGMHPDGEGPAGEAIFSDLEMENLSIDSLAEKHDKITSFRRIFYRAVDSVRVRTGDWAVIGGGRYLFYGVTLKSEFDSISPWYSLREMEESMVEEAEVCGDLYLRAGIVESSRYAWSLATQFYSETFNYARLAYVYRRLALVVTSQIPEFDARESNQIDLSSSIGRFYKVYFHGGAPDDLLGMDFVYRTPNSVQIKEFAARLETALRSVLPNKTTIDLVLDDGSPTVAPKGSAGGKRPAVIGGAPIEPVKIKVTPLRPHFRMEDTEKCFRGTPEWFQLKTEELDNIVVSEGKSPVHRGSSFHTRSHSICTTNTLSSVGSATMSHKRSSFLSKHRNTRSRHSLPNDRDKGGINGALVGVDRFYFTQPQQKDPVRGFRDWLKVPKSRIAERSLRVTELQVENCFPACVTRQKIIHRAVFTQSPLEASVEAVSTWCSVLFRTIIATNGLGVLGGQRDQGLNAAAAKVVADCIHSSGVKQIGLTFLSVNAPSDDRSNETPSMYSTSKTMLTDEEIERVQTKLARIIVTFLELLHLLIARNRDVLLAVVQARKRKGGIPSSGSVHSGYAAPSRAHYSPMKGHVERQNSESAHTFQSSSDIVGKSIIAEKHGHGHTSNNSDRTDAAIGVQSELQRGFIGLVKTLSPHLLDAINNEVPRWMRQCSQDNYFSTGLYRQAEIPIGEELFFNVDTSGSDEDRGSKSDSSYQVPRSIIERGPSGATYRGSSPNGSLCGTEISDTRHVDRAPSISSERIHPDRSSHRRVPSGASYNSSKGAF